jgi:hypothetical protein
VSGDRRRRKTWARESPADTQAHERARGHGSRDDPAAASLGPSAPSGIERDGEGGRVGEAVVR